MSEFLDSLATPSIPAPTEDRWLYPRGVAYAAVGAASLLVPLYALVVRGVALPAVPLAVTVTDNLAALLVVFSVIGAAWSVIVVTATELVGRLSTVDRRRQAFGAFTALSGLGAAIGSAVGGALAVRIGYGAMFFLSVVVVVVGAGLSLLAWRRNRTPA